jgi:hypothetical protein
MSSAQDAAALTAATGLAWLATYEAEGDENAFTAGLSDIRRCLEQAPDHPEHDRWRLWLALGHAEHGRRLGRIEDYDRSIDILSELYLGGLTTDQLREQVAATLADVGCDRLWLHRRNGTPDESASPATLTEVANLVTRMSPLLTGGADPRGRWWARLSIGLAQLERYELTRTRVDLDRGVDLLATATWDLVPGTPLLGRVAAELANGLRCQGVLDGDRVRLEQAVTTADRALRDGDPGDELTRHLLAVVQAYAHEACWRVTQDTEYLAATLACWRAALGDDGLTIADAFSRLDRSLHGSSG